MNKLFFILFLLPFVLLSQNKTDIEYFESGNKKIIQNAGNKEIDYLYAAITDYREAIEINPKSVKAYYARAVAIMTLIYLEEFESEDYGLAMNDINTAISIDNNNYRFFLKRAELKYLQEDYYGSINDAKNAIDRFKNFYNQETDFHRGYVHPIASRIGYTKKDENIEVYYMYFSLTGFSKLQLGDYDGAMNDLNEAIKIGDSQFRYYSRCYNERGYVKYVLDDINGALSDLSKSIELQEDKTSYYYRSIIKSDLEDFDGAIEDISKAIKLKPQGNYYATLGYFKSQKGYYKQAAQDMLKAVELEPENIEFKYISILYIHNSGKSKEALKELNKNLKNFSNTPFYCMFFRLRAKIKIGLNESDEAEKGLGLNDIKGGCLDLKKGLELAKKLTEEDLKDFEYLYFGNDEVQKLIKEFCN